MWKWLTVAALLAGVFVCVSADLGAQAPPIDPNQGGPLWWVPMNDFDPDAPVRHHDRWYASEIEALEHDWGAATSFPYVAFSLDEVWELTVSGAPPNSACDFQYLETPVVTGPPDNRSWWRTEQEDANIAYRVFIPPLLYPVGGGVMPGMASKDEHREFARRVPSQRGYGGLQISIHVGEWWQGMRDRRTLPGLDRIRYGSFFVDPAAGSCLSDAMVAMHGQGGAGPGGVWPDRPTGADGNPCWSNARPFLLRANSEARCEPNLAVRFDASPAYPYTELFYSDFDNRPTLPIDMAGWPGGGDYLPAFPSDYSPPYLMGRRGEVALYPAAEHAEAAGVLTSDPNVPQVPWSTASGHPSAGSPQFGQLQLGAARHTRQALADRFLDPDRVDPFCDPSTGSCAYGDSPGSYGNNMITLYNSELNTLECLELGEPGWDAVNGVFRPHCHQTTGRATSVETGRVNRVLMGYGTQRRTREVGPVDHSPGAPNSASTLGRASGHARVMANAAQGLWAAPGGYRWYEHRASTMGCRFFEAETDMSLDSQAYAFQRAKWAQIPALYAEYQRLLAQITSCAAGSDGDACRARNNALRAMASMVFGRAVTLFREGYGWLVIGDYRASVEGPFLAALRGASGGPPAGYGGPNPGRVLIAWRDLTAAGVGRPPLSMLSNGHCETAMDNEVLSPTWATAGRAGSIPLEGGPTWYGSDPFAAYGASAAPRSGRPQGQCDHGANMADDCYTQFRNPMGRTTLLAEEQVTQLSALASDPELRYPEELTGAAGVSQGHPAGYNRLRSTSGLGPGGLGGGSRFEIWRDFACPTIHSGYYGVELEAVGTQTQDPRFDSTDGRFSDQTSCPGPNCPWWRAADPGVAVAPGSARQFTSGTPCTGNPAYDVPGCFDPGSRVGAYSTGQGHFGIEYFGDGRFDAGVSGGRTREMQPNSYLLETHALVFRPRGNFFHMGLGYRSLDLERDRIWAGYGSWVQPAALESVESYAGVPPGVVRSSGALTERASVEHDGPVRWFGAGAMGGTGGCVLLTTDGGTLRADTQPTVWQDHQRLACLLPVTAATRPEGKCPGPGLPWVGNP